MSFRNGVFFNTQYNLYDFLEIMQDAFHPASNQSSIAATFEKSDMWPVDSKKLMSVPYDQNTDAVANTLCLLYLVEMGNAQRSVAKLRILGDNVHAASKGFVETTESLILTSDTAIEKVAAKLSCDTEIRPQTDEYADKREKSRAKLQEERCVRLTDEERAKNQELATLWRINGANAQFLENNREQATHSCVLLSYGVQLLMSVHVFSVSICRNSVAPRRCCFQAAKFNNKCVRNSPHKLENNVARECPGQQEMQGEFFSSRSSVWADYGEDQKQAFNASERPWVDSSIERECRFQRPKTGHRSLYTVKVLKKL